MENTLNIQITLNDEQLKNLIVGNLNDLPKEKLQEVLLQGIKEVLTSEAGKQLFIRTGGYYGSDKCPSTFLEKLVKEADISDAISPIVNAAVAEFSANYSTILSNCIKSSISEMFWNQCDRSQFVRMWDVVTHKEY
jgi:hypothetical protein